MKTICIPVGIDPAYPTNCWLAVNEAAKELLIIDPGFHPQIIKEEIQKTGATPAAILLTHGHYDHMMAVEQLRTDYQIPVYAAEADLPFLQNPEWNQSFEKTGTAMVIIPDVLLQDGALLQLAGLDLCMLHTPGHTYGSACWYLPQEKTLFSGDTIFKGRHGKTIWATGSAEDMKHSLLEKLMKLPEETLVLTGHEGPTTIAEAKTVFAEEYGVEIK